MISAMPCKLSSAKPSGSISLAGHSGRPPALAETSPLLQAVAKQLGPEHTQPLFLWVLDGNEPAKRFYARMGAEFAEQSMTDPFGGLSLPEWRCVWRDPFRLLDHAA